MKVKELIKQLKEKNQESIVIISSNSDGNSFNPLGDVGYLKLIQKLDKKEDQEDYVIEDEVPCLVMYPIN